LFRDGRAETVALKKKSGSKLPHSKRNLLQSEVYQNVKESQGKLRDSLVWMEAAKFRCHEAANVMKP